MSLFTLRVRGSKYGAYQKKISVLGILANVNENRKEWSY